MIGIGADSGQSFFLLPVRGATAEQGTTRLAYFLTCTNFFFLSLFHFFFFSLLREGRVWRGDCT